MSRSQTYKIAVGQFSPALGDVAANATAASAWCRRARQRGAKGLVLPELAMHGYLLEELALDTALKGSSPALAKVGKASVGLELAMGAVMEDSKGAVFNSGLLFKRGRVEAQQDKMYPPSYGMFDEARYFRGGGDLAVTNFGPFKAAMLLCEDAWHASLPLIAAQRGAELMLVLASSPARGFRPGDDGPSIRRTWTSVLGSMAETLGVYVVFANRVGVEDGVGFWGGSMVIAPDGDVVAEAPLYEEALLEAELDPGAVKRVRKASPLAASERLDFNARAFAQLAGWSLQPPKPETKRKKR